MDRKFKVNYYVLSCIMAISIFFGNKANAVVKLPAIISDNMLLQNNIKAPIWGWADPGEEVQLQFKGKKYKVTATTDGKWLIKIDASTAGGPFEMEIKGKENTIKINNILVGEVWVASGQSNMEFGIQTDSLSNKAISSATDSKIRLFFVTWATALQPQNDITSAPAGSLNGKWVVCSPEVMANPQWAWHGFSAVGYYFAQQLRKSTGKPIGMIATYKGGTPAQAWVSAAGLQQEPAFKNHLSKHQMLLDNYEKEQAAYPQKQAEFQASLKQWNETGKDQSAKSKPQAPTQPDGGFNAPSNLYNGMVSPIIPYGIKGVIWYQGESNGDRYNDAIEYFDLFPRLIADWRNHWAQGTFPFLFVQLTNFKAPAVTASEGRWPWVRDAQLKTLSVPKTGMAVIIDVGDPGNIHPKNKYDVGKRLALVARHVAYGENLVYSGPIYKEMTVKGNEIHISFTNTGGGLRIGSSPGKPQPSADVELKGFGIAGADKKFVWAKAVLRNNTIIVSAKGVTQPVAVRYDWADNPPGNLYNKEGLPASPFRTDNWPAADSEKW